VAVTTGFLSRPGCSRAPAVELRLLDQIGQRLRCLSRCRFRPMWFRGLAAMTDPVAVAAQGLHRRGARTGCQAAATQPAGIRNAHVDSAAGRRREERVEAAPLAVDGDRSPGARRLIDP
jgi:hypothetical protein